MALTVWEKMSHIDISWSQPSPARSGGQFAQDFHTLTAAPPVLYPHFFSKWGLQIWRPVVFNTINFTVYIWLTIWIQWGVDTYESTRGWVHFLYTVYDFTIFFLHIICIKIIIIICIKIIMMWEREFLFWLDWFQLSVDVCVQRKKLVSVKSVLLFVQK